MTRQIDGFIDNDDAVDGVDAAAAAAAAAAADAADADDDDAADADDGAAADAAVTDDDDDDGSDEENAKNFNPHPRLHMLMPVGLSRSSGASKSAWWNTVAVGMYASTTARRTAHTR